MAYQYIHDESKEVVEIELPMASEKPRTIERDGKTYRFMWPFEGAKRAAIIVPEGFGSSDNSFNYDKRPSGTKKLY